MADQMHPWQMELGEYIRQGEPDRAKKAELWKTAIGLQQVDGLEVSDYLVDTAKMHIEGAIDTRGARERIESYYEERRERGIIESQSTSPKCNDCTLDCTLEQLSVLRELAMNSRVTQKQLAGLLGVSERTVKTRTVELQSKGLLRREGGRRNGHWVVSESVLGALGL